MEPKKDDPGAIPEPSDLRIEFEALFIKLSVKQGSVHLSIQGSYLWILFMIFLIVQVEHGCWHRQG